MVAQIFSPIVQTTLGVINVSGRDEPETQVYSNVRIDSLLLGYVMRQTGHTEPNAEVIGEALRMMAEFDVWERKLWETKQSQRTILLAEWQHRGGLYAKAAQEIREEIKREERR